MRLTASVSLFVCYCLKVNSLTGEGGKLKKTLMLVRSRDFELVPDSLWKALSQWYGGSLALPRQVGFYFSLLILSFFLTKGKK